ncbi:hypothetical protein OAS39_10090, partial [Pirellulales bacterium]|nr:hypothetical protein [Pirellulales bacterium]
GAPKDGQRQRVPEYIKLNKDDRNNPPEIPAHDEPKIKLNWQAKLTPVTSQQVDMAASRTHSDEATAQVMGKRVGAHGSSRHVLVNH